LAIGDPGLICPHRTVPSLPAALPTADVAFWHLPERIARLGANVGPCHWEVVHIRLILAVDRRWIRWGTCHDLVVATAIREGLVSRRGF
jgi:hypothetical protein